MQAKRDKKKIGEWPPRVKWRQAEHARGTHIHFRVTGLGLFEGTGPLREQEEKNHEVTTALNQSNTMVSDMHTIDRSVQSTRKVK